MRTHYRFVVAVVAVVGSFLSVAIRADAAFVFNLTQVGQQVLASGSGTINTSALSVVNSSASGRADVDPSLGILVAGPATSTLGEGFSGLTGPATLGTNVSGVYPENATAGSGDPVGVGFGTSISLPLSYVSGTPLADSATFLGTFAAIGLNQGTYLYTWGSGPTADSLTINIGTVPEPATAAVLAIPASLALLRRRRALR